MAGFATPTVTNTPDALFDYWLPRLRPGELRVLLYVIRRTFGFGRDGDAISLDQFEHGIRTADGRFLDHGCGVGHATLLRSLRSLAERGLLIRVQHRGGNGRGGDETTWYSLALHHPGHPPPAGGFRAVNVTQVPDELFDVWLPLLGPAELAALCYIIRRTLGFRKISDVISTDQFLHGIMTASGRVLDEGCGVSRNALSGAISGLREKGLIRVERRSDPRRGSLPARYELVFAGEVPHGCDDTPARAETSHVDQRQSDERRSKSGQPVVHNWDGGGPLLGDEESRKGQPGGPRVGLPVVKKWATPTVLSSVDGGPHVGDRGDQSWTSQNTVETSGGPNRTGIHETGNKEQHQQSEPGGGHPTPCRMRFDDLVGLPLPEDAVLLESGDDTAEIVSIDELVRRDLADPSSRFVPAWTEPFFSVEHILGLGDDWTEAELARRARLVAARDAALACQRELGAPDVAKAVRMYFDDELAATYLAFGGTDALRLRAWLAYVHREGRRGSLKNPPGFLRSRLDSRRWPPAGGGRVPLAMPPETQ
jgi:hypothetical protein